jgi:tRNA A37 threonylcarbamoyladenosine biosynthesis protein TsaE
MALNVPEEMITYLSRTSAGLDLLLQATPYDDNRDLDGLLTERIFFDHLFVEKNDKFEATLAKFNKLASERKKIVFLEGHSGVGKTTIIKRFMYESRDTCFTHYVNCHEFTNTTLRSKFNERSLELLEEQIQKEEDEEKIDELREMKSAMRKDITEKEQENAITNIIREYIQSVPITDTVKNSFVFFLSNHRNALAAKLDGRSLKEELNKLPEIIKETDDYTDAWDNLFKEMETRDSFLLLFTFLEFLRTIGRDSLRTTEKTAAKSKVIIFDNLDAIPLDLLHKDFLKLFYHSLKSFRAVCNTINLHKSGHPFAADYNFIFALRDANNASIADHVVGSHDGITERISYRCGPAFYKDITTARLLFYVNKIEAFQGRYGTAGNIVALLNFLTEKNFYTETFIPAFNMDNRRLTKSLYRVGENFIPDKTKIKYSPDDWSEVFPIIFPTVPEKTISPFSIAQDVPQEHFNYKADIPPDQMAGFYGAVLYGMITDLNSIEFYQTKDGIDNNVGYCLASRMLLTLILNKSDIKDSKEFIEQNKERQKVELRSILKSTRDIYSENEVIKTLVGLFLVSEGGTYLLSFRKHQIKNKNAFDDLIKMKNNTGMWRRYAQDAELLITPAGFIFLRDLIIHYEFYSLLANNNKPLFMYTNKSDENEERDFVKAIRATYKIVAAHEDLMHKFYVNKFHDAGASAYLSSDFAFKNTRRTAKTEGVFHIERIVMAHVEYIDEYRRWLLKRAGDQSADVKSATNDKIIEFIERYINLLSNWKDKDKKIATYAQAVTENIEKIKASANNRALSVVPPK